MPSRTLHVPVTLLALALAGCPVDDPSDDGDSDDEAPRCEQPGPLDDTLRVTDLQGLGTHNSYHVRPEILLDGSWDWDLNYIYSRNQAVQETRGTYNMAHIVRGLGPLATCTADPTCVPINFFGGSCLPRTVSSFRPPQIFST